MKSSNANFNKWKEIWTYKKSLNQFLVQTREHQEQKQLW